MFSKLLITKQKTLVTTVLIAIAMLGLSIFLPYSIYQRNKAEVLKTKEQDTVHSGEIVSRYLVNTYELYYNSGNLKFQEVVININELSVHFHGFQILNMDGLILYDSNNPKDNYGISPLDRNLITSNKTTVLKDGDRVGTVIIPFFDDWGNHKYTVNYSATYNDVDERLGRFQLTMILVSLTIIAFILIILILSHFNERYRLEKERTAELEELGQVKDEFMNLVAHNLRTPLSVVKGYLSFMKGLSLDEEGKDNLKNMETGVNRLSSLVENIILATSILNGERVFEKKKFSLKEVVDKLEKKYADKIAPKKLKVKTHLPEKDSVVGDKTLVSTVFENLFDNAIKFNKQNGSIIIDVENNYELKFTIEDTGIGMKKQKNEDMASFFHKGSDPLGFEFEGEGLGLYLIHLVLDHYNGSMVIKSDPGQGTKIVVTMKVERDGLV